MDDIDPADRITLRQIGRRNLFRFPPLIIPAVLAWWFGSHWIEHHFHVEKNLANYGTLIVAILLVLGIVKATGLDHADPRLTPRLKRIAESASHRNRDRSLLWATIGFSILLLSQLLSVTLGAGSDRNSAWAWAFTAVALSLRLYGKEADLDVNEEKRRHQALYYGYLTITGLGAMLVVCESYWPGTASRYLAAVISAGILVPKIIASIVQRGTRTSNEIDSGPIT